MTEARVTHRVDGLVIPRRLQRVFRLTPFAGARLGGTGAHPPPRGGRGRLRGGLCETSPDGNGPWGALTPHGPVSFGKGSPSSYTVSRAVRKGFSPGKGIAEGRAAPMNDAILKAAIGLPLTQSMPLPVQARRAGLKAGRTYAWIRNGPQRVFNGKCTGLPSTWGHRTHRPGGRQRRGGRRSQPPCAATSMPWKGRSGVHRGYVGTDAPAQAVEAPAEIVPEGRTATLVEVRAGNPLIRDPAVDPPGRRDIHTGG